MSKTSKASIALTLMTPLAAFILASCARNEAAEAPPAPPPVQAAKVVLKQVTEFDEFTGALPPWIRIVSPAFSYSVSSTVHSAVSPVSASAAASTCVMLAGFFATMAPPIAIFSE